LIENAGHELNVKLTAQMSGHEIGRHKNDGREIEGKDRYLLKIDYVTMQCAV